MPEFFLILAYRLQFANICNLAGSEVEVNS